MTLDQVLADWRGDAQRLRLRGHPHDADLIEQFATAVADAAHDYLTTVEEDDAIRRTNRSRSWLRARFPEWERQGHAGYRGRAKRWYRLVVLPLRANDSAAYEAGRADGRKTG